MATPITLRKQLEGPRFWEESLWSYDGSGGGAEPPKFWDSLEEGLSHVLSALLPKKEIIERLVAEYDAVWWCGHFQSGLDGGPTLSASLLRQLAAFGPPVFIDNYFSDNGNER